VRASSGTLPRIVTGGVSISALPSVEQPIPTERPPEVTRVERLIDLRSVRGPDLGNPDPPMHSGTTVSHRHLAERTRCPGMCS
jgi:hypothetical protein